jgi:hypothetical protein
MLGFFRSVGETNVSLRSYRQSNFDEHRSAGCANFVAERCPGTFPCRKTSYCATNRDMWCSLIRLVFETVVERMDSEVRGSPATGVEVILAKPHRRFVLIQRRVSVCYSAGLRGDLPENGRGVSSIPTLAFTLVYSTTF